MLCSRQNLHLMHSNCYKVSIACQKAGKLSNKISYETARYGFIE